MPRYDHFVRSYQIKPAVGGRFGWGAKATVKETGTGRNDDAVNLSEWLGTTEAEAMAKAEKEAREWIAERSSGD